MRDQNTNNNNASILDEVKNLIHIGNTDRALLLFSAIASPDQSHFSALKNSAVELIGGDKLAEAIEILRFITAVKSSSAFLAANVTSPPSTKSTNLKCTVTYGNGFYPSENSWRWCDKVGHMTLENIPKSGKIFFEVACGKAEQYPLFPFNIFVYAGESSAYSFTFETSEQVIQVMFPLEESEAEIIIESDQYFVPALLELNTDTRRLAFRVMNLNVSADGASLNRIEEKDPDIVSSLKSHSAGQGEYRFYGEANNRDYRNALETFLLNPTVMLELNSECNFHCHYCRSADSKRQKSFMKPELFRHLLPQLKGITTLPLRLHNDGEPTLHPQFLELSLEANRAGHRIALATNGSNLRKEFLRIDMDVIINISCTAEELKQRTSMNFTTYVSRLENYVKDWLSDGCTQNIIMKIYTGGKERANRAEVETKQIFASEFISRLGIATMGTISGEESYRVFEYLKPGGGAFQLSFQPLAEGGLYPNISGFHQPGNCLPAANGFCDSAWKVLSVLSDGTVCFCCVDITGETGFTHPDEVWNKGLKDIWLNHSKVTELRKQFLAGKVNLPICKKCLEVAPHREQYIFPELFTYVHQLCKVTEEQ